jgi:hypothetical protein
VNIKISVTIKYIHFVNHSYPKRLSRVVSFLDLWTCWNIELTSSMYIDKFGSEGPTMPHKNVWAQQASSSHQCECGESENVHLYSRCVVLCVILTVMCICVIYKFLSLGL